MRYLLFCVLFVSFVCAQGKINVVVSVIPQIYLVEKIGGIDVDVSSMVPDGRSPETYEPLISQMKMIKNASVYFGVGMDFEKAWKPRFISANPLMEFVDLSEIGIKKQDQSNQFKHKHDPHIWLSVALAKVQAEKIYETLSNIRPLRKSFYQANLEEFLKEINALDSQIKGIFSKPNAQKSFVVYHPAFGYLAKEYGLEEIALENDGKPIKLKQMIGLRDVILKKDIKVAYVQPEFSKDRIKAFANELHLKILTLDPLRADWKDNILHICKMIASQGNVE
ncbi:zinc ABC transporter substrate-binding protein [Helicobacter sp. 13S00477-4]|uniref:metal ABC transporter solute-binding protein, Zn/Mn family n=1 Tax=Helicobacter sp. 13S00477-4 TaxID=1905759 RepID=UPI000BCF2B83|nr:zinc ABC transporter substrate-binding protein [Helicobacter sp. 13S00477-4]PAF50817.1 hypothetical protein BKH44_06600 [Helicobacter sp. 13S00477-4]